VWIPSQINNRRGIPRIALCCALLLAMLFVDSMTSAQQPSATDRAVARSLFEKGRELMAAGNYAEACAKLAESYRLDPGAGTLLNLAACHEAEGKLASAWVEFNDSLTRARREGRSEREQVAQEHIRAIEPRLSRLTVNVDATGNVPGLELRLDGGVLNRPGWGTAIPIDPGLHKIEARAPGKMPWSIEITVGLDAESKTVDIPPLLDAPPEPKPSAAPTVSSAPTPPGPEQQVPDRRRYGYISTGVGLVAVGFGSYFGLLAKSRWDDRNAHCPDGVCDSQAVKRGDQANTAAWISNVAFGVGVAGLGAAAYFFLAGRSASAPAKRDGVRYHVTPAVGPSVAAVAVGGAW
jgi:hypothetical protein